MSNSVFTFWRAHNRAPYHFPMDEATWTLSREADVDNEGRPLFSSLKSEVTRDSAGQITGLIEYGKTAFGFDQSGEISQDIHFPVIRTLCFDEAHMEDGRKLLQSALNAFCEEARVYAFFHYFGMSACARHGKLHASSPHVEKLLLDSGFQVEHENVYYARTLTGEDTAPNRVALNWKALSPGSCREFAALHDGTEVGWGQLHFLPQGDIAYLRWIYVDEKRQHQGLGTAIMRQLFAELYQMGIRRFDTDTALSNTAAQQYYEKTGFSNEGITRSYYK